MTIGSTTHGNLSGVAAFAVLPCGLVARISNGYICDAKDRPIEGQGNEPDVSVSPTIADVLNGKDPVLDKAVSLLAPGTTRTELVGKRGRRSGALRYALQRVLAQ